MRRWWLVVVLSMVPWVVIAAGACGDDETNNGPGGGTATGGAAGMGGAGGHGGFGNVRVLANDQHRPARIKIDEGHVYWLTQGERPGAGGGGSTGSGGGGGAAGSGGGGIEGTVIKVPKDGGTPTLLATAPVVTALTVDNAYVYWSRAEEDQTGTLFVVSTAGGESDHVVDTTGWPADLTADDQYLYWTQVGTQGGVWRMLKPEGVDPDAGVPDGGVPDGGPAGQLYSGSEFVTFLAVDDSAVYFTDTGFGTAIGAVGAINLATGSSELLIEDLGWPWHLAVGDSDVYFATELDGNVRSVAKTGASDDILASEQNRPYGIAADESAVYWTNRATNPATGACESAEGTVMTVALSGGTPRELASGQACPYAIVVDDVAVYWVNHGLDDQPYSGSVMRVPKL